MGALQSSPSMKLINPGSDSTVLTEVSSVTWKNTSAGKVVLRAAAFASSPTSEFLLLSTYSTMKPLKWFSTLLTRARYFSRVHSLAMLSFLIWPETTFEFVLGAHVWTLSVLSLRSPNNMASYSSILLEDLSMSFVNYSLVA
jgi:hypothetical protein